MKERPIKILVDALRQLGAKIEYVEGEGFPPIKITGQKLIKSNVALLSSPGYLRKVAVTRQEGTVK
jgi:5-enolpyruvylshikimate-3-phosphate synthase